MVVDELINVSSMQHLRPAVALQPSPMGENGPILHCNQSCHSKSAEMPSFYRKRGKPERAMAEIRRALIQKISSQIKANGVHVGATKNFPISNEKC